MFPATCNTELVAMQISEIKVTLATVGVKVLNFYIIKDLNK
jgi:hypothetical protein